MGIEANCTCRWNGGTAQVKALLEAHELMLRGELRRRIAVADLRDVAVDGEALRFAAADEAFALDLGAVQAQRWARKIATPPPSLSEKLGVGPTSKVWVIGTLDEPTLMEALAGVTTSHPQEVTLSLSVVRSDAELARALELHAAQSPNTSIWIVYEKGSKAAFGEGAVRTAMRGMGYKDNKVCAVSATLTAARFHRD